MCVYVCQFILTHTHADIFSFDLHISSVSLSHFCRCVIINIIIIKWIHWLKMDCPWSGVDKYKEIQTPTFWNSLHLSPSLSLSLCEFRFDTWNATQRLPHPYHLLNYYYYWVSILFHFDKCRSLSEKKNWVSANAGIRLARTFPDSFVLSWDSLNF